MKRKFSEFFIDVDGGLSFKRLQSAVYTVILVAVFIMFFINGMILPDSLLGALIALLGLNYAGITAEKFTDRGKTSIEANDEAMLAETKADIEIKKEETSPKTPE